MRGCAEHSRGGSILGTAPLESSYLLIQLAKPWPGKLKKLKEIKSFIKQLDRELKGRAPEPKVIATPELESPALLIRWTDQGALCLPLPLSTGAVVEALSSPPRGESKPLYLVCTHGSRDRCCGSLGFPVYKALTEQSDRQVYQVSHLGGHRYAPLVLAMPEWRFFGHLTPETALDLDRRLSQRQPYLEGYRGHGRLDKEAQVVEGALWEEHGSSLVRVEQEASDKDQLAVRATLDDGRQLLYKARVGWRETRGYKSCEDMEKGKEKTISLPALIELVKSGERMPEQAPGLDSPATLPP